MKQRLKLDADDIAPENILYILYFCSTFFIWAVSKILGSETSKILYVIFFLSLMILCIIKHDFKFFFWPIAVYLSVALLFFITFIFHPEYKDWYSHSVYGIIPSFLNPTKGIWAFLIVYLVKDEKRQMKNLKIVCFLLFMFNILRFIIATRRGYWITTSVSGETLNQAYSLEFGYEMLFPTAFMGTYAFLNKKKVYYIPFVIGLYTILMGGSRGAILWPIAMFPLMLPFCWKNMDKRKRRNTIVLFVLLFLIGTVVFLFYDLILSALLSLLNSFGLESRTISAVLSGSFSDGNGREQIYKIAIELIKTGGAFGWGVYGDRYVIADRISWAIWGYSHNVVLEILVSFGWLLGSLICGIIIKKIVDLYHDCNNIERQIIFITFFVTSFKLILSSSFWYSAPFWAIFALSVQWKKQQKVHFRMVA